MNVLIGVVTGQATVAAAQGILSEAADLMRQAMLADSSKFTGVTDGITTYDNLSASSEGVRGDGKKLGGTVGFGSIVWNGQQSLQNNHGRAARSDSHGRVQFDRDAAGMSLDKFLNTEDGRKRVGDTGGIQGVKGTFLALPMKLAVGWTSLSNRSLVLMT